MSGYRSLRITERDERLPVSRFNDHVLEYVIAALRALACVGVVAFLVSTFGLIWTADLRWLATLVVVMIVAGVAGWLGFWTFGNQEWRNG